MHASVVLFTRDLRVRDNPALHAACATGGPVVPLFVLDPRVRSSANRDRFLVDSLADLRESLRLRGGDLVVRHGDPVAETLRLARAVGASRVTVAADVSGYAKDRQRRLVEAGATDRISVEFFDGVTIVPPGAVRPSSGADHYRVFTPYWRAWLAYPRRPMLTAPRRIVLPEEITAGSLPSPTAAGSPQMPRGGEAAALDRLAAWRRRAAAYPDLHDRMAVDGTSRLSPYLHFGCVSPLVVADRSHGPDEFLRQLCWRDFYHQVLAAFPALGRDAYRPGARENWVDNPTALDAWRSGETGVPIVDAGMRQLGTEGFVHNRARLIVASYLTKQLRLDWRLGAEWFAHLLVDADVANNNGNWQWVAGTGSDTKPYRRFNPIRQAHRYDPDGDYVRRWVPELADIPGRAIHEPWLRPAQTRSAPLSPAMRSRSRRSW